MSSTTREPFVVRASVTIALAMALTIVCSGGAASARASDQRSANASADFTRVIHWRDVEPLSEGGKLVFETTRIRVVGSHFSITSSVTNESPASVQIHTFPPRQDPTYLVRGLSFGIAYREPASPGTSTRRFINIRAATFAPTLPDALAPGETWRGTFSGQSPTLQKHRTWWIAFGQFFPGGYWLTEKTFAT